MAPGNRSFEGGGNRDTGRASVRRRETTNKLNLIFGPQFILPSIINPSGVVDVVLNELSGKFARQCDCS